jgi:nucleoid-associated protein YgaU
VPDPVSSATAPTTSAEVGPASPEAGQTPGDGVVPVTARVEPGAGGPGGVPAGGVVGGGRVEPGPGSPGPDPTGGGPGGDPGGATGWTKPIPSVRYPTAKPPTANDAVRGAIGIPSGAISYHFTLGGTPTHISAPNHPPTVPGAPTNLPSAPHVTPPAPQHPQHIGGGTFVVRPGDNLYNIARERLGNPNLYPLIQAANPHIVPPSDIIRPGQVIHIPSLPRPPENSVAQVVQPGDSVWEIANGNPELAQRIVELNHLRDPSQIQPGQVLIVPPAS